MVDNVKTVKGPKSLVQQNMIAAYQLQTQTGDPEANIENTLKILPILERNYVTETEAAACKPDKEEGKHTQNILDEAYSKTYQYIAYGLLGHAYEVAEKEDKHISKVFEAIIDARFSKDTKAGKNLGLQATLNNKGIWKFDMSRPESVLEVREILDAASRGSIPLSAEFLASRAAAALEMPNVQRKGHEDNLAVLFIHALKRKYQAEYQLNPHRQEAVIRADKEKYGNRKTVEMLSKYLDFNGVYRAGHSDPLDEVCEVITIVPARGRTDIRKPGQDHQHSIGA